ncbi:hypothetical protein PFISCL1PPCAC_16505, partial [Pristionchus fissidentatus]
RRWLGKWERRRKRQRRMGRSWMVRRRRKQLLPLALARWRRMGRRRRTIRRQHGLSMHAVLRLDLEDVETELLLGPATNAPAEIVRRWHDGLISLAWMIYLLKF